MLALLFFAFIYSNTVIAENLNFQQFRRQPIIIGRQYSFNYNAQTSTIFGLHSTNNKKALNRLQATVNIFFKTQTEGFLQLRNISIAQSINNENYNENLNPLQMQPINSFRYKQLINDFNVNQELNELKQHLFMPVWFEYTEDRKIKNIQFNKKEEISTRNLKKAILNLLQLNINFNDDSDYSENNTNFLYKKNFDQDNNLDTKSFQNFETTIEGECETNYVVSSVPNSNKLNITKTINFNLCKELPVVSYGSFVDQMLPQTKYESNESDYDENLYINKQILPKQTLDKSTVIHYILSVPSENDLNKRLYNLKKKNKFEIEHVEVLSKYTMQLNTKKTDDILQTITLGQLNYIESDNEFELLNDEFINYKNFDKKESIMYNTKFEFTEKSFIMNGDNEFLENSEETYAKFLVYKKDDNNADNRNFMNKIANKFEYLVSLYNVNEEENLKELNEPKTAEKLKNVVEIMRMCTVKGLKTLLERATSANKSETQTKIAREIFADALAMTATKNSITVLVEMIMQKKIDEVKALQILQSLNSVEGLLAPSELQIDEIVRLCNSNKLEWKITKQACWLTFGTMVGALRQQSEQAQNIQKTNNLIKNLEIAAAHKMDLYAKLLVKNLLNNDDYNKIVAFKAIGNAALENTVDEMLKIIQNNKLENNFRLNAINALHRILDRQSKSCQKNKLLLKIYFKLLPFLKNVRQKTEIRMASAAMLFTNIVSSKSPLSQDFIEQIIENVQSENNKDIVSFVNEIVDDLSKSTVFQHQEIAKHLKNLTNFDKFSNNNIDQSFLHNQNFKFDTLNTKKNLEQHDFNIFLHYIKIYSYEFSQNNLLYEKHTDNFLTKMSIDLETYYNGHYQRQSWPLNVLQNNVDKILKFFFSSNEKKKDNNNEYYTKNTSFLRNTLEQVNRIFRKIKSDSEKQQNKNSNTHVSLTVRYNNVDVIALPIDAELMQILRNIKTRNNVQKLKSMLIKSLQIISLSRNNRKSNKLINFSTAMLLQDNAIRIPSSVGMPIKIIRRKTLFGVINFDVHENNKTLSDNLIMHPNINYAEDIEMRCWLSSLAGISSGMSSTITIKLNLPVNVKILNLKEENYFLKTTVLFNIPQQKTHLFRLHSFNNIFIAYKSKTKNLQTDFKKTFDMIDAMIYTKTISELNNYNSTVFQQRQIDMIVLKNNSLSLPLHIYGHYYIPKQYNFENIIEVLRNTYNLIDINFLPIKGETPEQLKFTIRSKPFEKIFKETHQNYSWDDIRSNINKQYTNVEILLNSTNDFFVKKEEESITNKNKLLEDKINVHTMAHYFIKRNFKLSNYNHLLEIVFETINDNKNLKVELEVYAICDNNLQICESNFKLIRSLMQVNETKPWTLEMRVQNIYFNSKIERNYNKDQFLKTYTQISIKWGILNTKQRININMIGKSSIDNTNTKEMQLNFEPEENCCENCLELNETKKNFNNKQNLSFLNQFKIIAQIEITDKNRNYFYNFVEALKLQYNKVFNFDHLDEKKLSKVIQLKALVCIDSETRKHAKILLKTSEKQIVLHNIKLPYIYNLLKLHSKQQTNLIQDYNHTSNLIKNVLSKVILIKEDNSKNLKHCRFNSINDLKTKIYKFNGLSYNSTLSSCFTVLASDCSNYNNQPKYTVLIKKSKNSVQNKTTVVLIRNNDIIEIEKNEFNSKLLKVTFNHKTYTQNLMTMEEKNKLEKNLIFFGSNLKNPTVIAGVLDTLILEFDGRDGHILLSSDYQNTQCGFCGDYNEEKLLMYINQLPSNIKEFYRSILLNNNNNCFNENFYNLQNKFLKKDMIVNSFSSRSNENNEEQLPILKTVWIDHGHKNCFSLKPIRQCPDGWHKINFSKNQNMVKREPISFACIDSMSSAAKRLKKQILYTGIVDTKGYTTTYTELMILPQRCKKYLF